MVCDVGSRYLPSWGGIDADPDHRGSSERHPCPGALSGGLGRSELHNRLAGSGPRRRGDALDLVRAVEGRRPTLDGSLASRIARRHLPVESDRPFCGRILAMSENEPLIHSGISEIRAASRSKILKMLDELSDLK